MIRFKKEPFLNIKKTFSNIDMSVMKSSKSKHLYEYDLNIYSSPFREKNV